MVADPAWTQGLHALGFRAGPCIADGTSDLCWALSMFDQRNSVYLGHLAAIPIYVHWSAFVLVLLAWQWSSGGGPVDPVYVTLFTIILVLAILLHELGHGLMAKVLGAFGVRITLWAMGGLCSSMRDSLPRREILILAAGPAVSFLLAGLSYGALHLIGEYAPEWLQTASGRRTLLFDGLVLGYVINLILGIFNILPIFPLDGGQIVFNTLRLFLDLRRTIALTLSIGVVFALAFLAWRFHTTGTLDPYTIILIGFLQYNAFTTLR